MKLFYIFSSSIFLLLLSSLTTSQSTSDFNTLDTNPTITTTIPILTTTDDINFQLSTSSTPVLITSTVFIQQTSSTPPKPKPTKIVPKINEPPSQVEIFEPAAIPPSCNLNSNYNGQAITNDLIFLNSNNSNFLAVPDAKNLILPSRISNVYFYVKDIQRVDYTIFTLKATGANCSISTAQFLAYMSDFDGLPSFGYKN
ncbi:hypothetical protein HDU92_001611 [Lobulomyces angularis]|nr:hypothetical protein HDU92_001611 [Lobulomyces angularis]